MPDVSPALQGTILAILTLEAYDSIILRTAQRKARELGLIWQAVYLEMPADKDEHNISRRNRVLEQLALAERMGAKVSREVVPGLEQGVRKTYNAIQALGRQVRFLVAGETRRRWGWFAGPTMSKVVANVCDHGCVPLLLTMEPEELPPSNIFRQLSVGHLQLDYMLYGLLGVGIAFVATAALSLLLPATAQILEVSRYMIFLLACVIVSGCFGLLPGLVASVASFVIINVFYVAPQYSLTISSAADALAMGLFLIIAVLASFFNSRVHAEAEAAETSQHRLQALLHVYKIVSHARTRNEALSELHDNLLQFLHAESAFFLATVMQPDTLERVWPRTVELTARDRELLEECWHEGRHGSHAATYNRGTGWRFEPLITANGELGVLAMRFARRQRNDSSFNDYLRMVAELVASILEKIEVTHMTEENRVKDEREKLRTMLLSSVSHDLKTPLASIIGSLGVYRSMYDRLPEAQRNELTLTALEEAQRLDSFITNILDLAKMESGAIRFRREWQNPEDIISRVRKRLRLKLEEREVNVRPLTSPLEVEMDVHISEQALSNIIDNAVKYSPAGTPIDITMEGREDGFYLRVHDHGSGVPDGDRERIFDKYTRIQRQDKQVAGTGLGLALARACMEGQDGRIEVEDNAGGGAVFSLVWPVWRPLPQTGRKSREKAASS